MRLLVLGLALALAACSSPESKGKAGSEATFNDSSEPLSASLMKPMPARETMAATDAAAPAPPGGGSVPSPASQVVIPAGAPMLAYVHAYAIEAPANRIRGLITGHEAACAAAGPSQCQVTSSAINEAAGDSVTGTLELRASEAWVKRLRDGLPGETKAVGGKVVSDQVSSEDLSRQIVDTEARVRAMTTLRDRLMALLAERPGKLADVVEIERELARVQGDIDSTASQLAVMRGRVQMSTVTISYRSKGVLASESAWTPLTNALQDFLGIIAFTLAAMIRLVAWLAPWILVGAGVAWLFRKRLPQRFWPFGRKPPPAPPADAP